MKDIVLVDKPKGITSFDVIRLLRKKLDIKKIGHSGTLDPLATGLMILGVNGGTKKLEAYIKLDKVYEAEILLGIKTNTGDREGEIVERAVVSEFDAEKLEKALKEFEGTHELPIPMFSAKKVKGKKLFDLARSGIEIETQTKEMTFFYINLLRTEKGENNTFKVFVETKVSSGTFIRTLAEELGTRLGIPATLGNLRRTQVGPFNVKDADFKESDLGIDDSWHKHISVSC